MDGFQVFIRYRNERKSTIDGLQRLLIIKLETISNHGHSNSSHVFQIAHSTRWIRTLFNVEPRQQKFARYPRESRKGAEHYQIGTL